MRYEDGGMGWWTDYPGADNNFSVRLAELTRVHVKLDADRQPNFVVVSLSDPLLYRCPILFMEDVGTAAFTAEERQHLRQFFLKGGFLWVDDFWGSSAWDDWVAADRVACCRRASSRSSTSRRRTRSCTRSTT